MLQSVYFFNVQLTEQPDTAPKVESSLLSSFMLCQQEGLIRQY